VAQSIGFHVEDSLQQPLTDLTLMEQEIIRRTWYSMYVLDRLLALQLGRPVAIHEEEYCVNLPSETDETACLFDGEAPQFPLEKKPSSIDYFVSVIKFSKILGQVISDLYRPSQVAIEPDRMLLSTTTIDERLTEWKLSLPRHLRFDLGHTFEKSMIFKRQVRLDIKLRKIVTKLT
jgi:Fungal specific transcription factor domain